jgi:tripartite-type tricarboxylate transporter receptor subunit TctC
MRCFFSGAATLATLRALTPAVLALAWGISTNARAQTPAAGSYPTKSIRMVVGFAPGGATDVISRILSPKLSNYLGQQVIIDNRPGADALLAMEIVAKAPPDGYTLLMNSSSQAINASVYKRVTFDTLKDFAPVVNVGEIPSLLAVHPSMPVKNVRELLQLARARKGELLYAASASSTYLATELFNRMAGIQMTRVAYKGAGPAMIGILSGEVQFMLTGIGPILPHVQSNKVRAIATTTMKRTAMLPHLPTVHESGVPGYESGVWYAMFAPAAVPRPIIDRINAESRRVMNEPDVKASIAGQAIDPAPGTPEELGRLVATEYHKWAKVVQEAGIKVVE